MRPSYPASLAAMLLMAAPAAAAPSPPVLAPASGAAAAPERVFSLLGEDPKHHILVADVGGAPRRFLFDTGEGVTMISPALAKAVGCTPWGNAVAFRMLGERLDLPRCDAAAFTLGGESLQAPTTIVYDLSAIAGKDSPPLDGAIGLDLFAGKVVTVQWRHRRVVLESAASAAQRVAGATEVPMRLSRPMEGSALDVNIGVRTPRGMAWMELDTGNSGPTVFVAPALAPLFGLSATTREPQPLALQMAPGIRLATKARVFPGMIMDGNIGLQLLDHYDVTLDLKEGRAWLSPSAP